MGSPTKGSWGLFANALLVLVVAVGVIPNTASARRSAAGNNDAEVLKSCPEGGDAHSARVRALNHFKRRMTAPENSDIDTSVTLTAMVAPGDDVSRWSDSHAASITGYVANVKVGGVESVNCHTHDPKYRDTHIELTLSPLHDSEGRHVIVEVTPQWRLQVSADGIDWSTQTLRRSLLGRWVRITGWLFYDEEHANASTNTARPGAHVWRATAWEIHPITKIEVLPGRPTN